MPIRVPCLMVAVAALIAASVPAGSAGASIDAGDFDDVPEGHTHFEAIQALADAGVASGYPDGNFRPDRDVTRGQVATLLATISHLETGQEPPFSDVPPDHVHAHGIAAAAEWGLVHGYPDGTYRPAQSISRGQMASMLAEAYRLESEGTPSFDDVGPDHPHAMGIAAVAEHDVAEGYDDGSYRPEGPVTRGQMAAFLSRADPQL